MWAGLIQTGLFNKVVQSIKLEQQPKDTRDVKIQRTVTQVGDNFDIGAST